MTTQEKLNVIATLTPIALSGTHGKIQEEASEKIREIIKTISPTKP